MQPSLFLREIDSACLQIYGEAESRRGFVRSYNRFDFNAKKNELEERAGWKRGQRLFHDDHGYGAVMEVLDSEDGPIVRVRFENGSEKRFLSEYQGRAYEKIGDDW